MTVYICPSWTPFPTHTTKNIASLPKSYLFIFLSFTFSSAFHKARILFCGSENHKEEEGTHGCTVIQTHNKPGFNFYFCLRFSLPHLLSHLISLPCLLICKIWIIILLSQRGSADQSYLLQCVASDNHNSVQSRISPFLPFYKFPPACFWRDSLALTFIKEIHSPNHVFESNFPCLSPLRTTLCFLASYGHCCIYRFARPKFYH